MIYEIARWFNVRDSPATTSGLIGDIEIELTTNIVNVNITFI